MLQWETEIFLANHDPLGLFTSRGGCEALNLLLVIRATAAEVYVTRPFAKTYDEMKWCHEPLHPLCAPFGAKTEDIAFV